jgi:hypothetical protein
LIWRKKLNNNDWKQSENIGLCTRALPYVTHKLKADRNKLAKRATPNRPRRSCANAGAAVGGTSGR